MTTYRLPDWLGGLPIAKIVLADSADPKVTVLVETDTTHATIGLDRDQLVEVKPPLPPEPPAGSIVLVVSQRYGDAYMGYRNVWLHNEMLGGWVCFGDRDHHISNWANVHGSGETITVLQPDPATDAPDMPWKGSDDEGDTLEVMPTATSVKIGVSYGTGSRYVLFKSGMAAEAGRAILRAAREVEQP